SRPGDQPRDRSETVAAEARGAASHRLRAPPLVRGLDTRDEAGVSRAGRGRHRNASRALLRLEGPPPPARGGPPSLRERKARSGPRACDDSSPSRVASAGALDRAPRSKDPKEPRLSAR